MPTAPSSLSVRQLDTIYFNQLAQLSAESVGLTRNILGDRDAMLGALTKGNHYEYTDPETGQPKEFGALRMTTDQADEFLNHFEVLDVQPNTDSGLSGIALRDKDTGQITVAYRSTEPRPNSYGGDAEHDILTNGQIGESGFAMAQTHDANIFLTQVAETYNTGADAQPIKLVAFSLSGNIIRTQAAMFPDLVSQAETIEDGNMAFNATGQGNVGNGAIADVMNTYDAVLADPFSASLDALPYSIDDSKWQQLRDMQSEAIRVVNGYAENPAEESPNGIYDDPVQQFAYEYTRAVHQTSYDLNALPGQDGVNPEISSSVVSVTSEAMTGLDGCLVSCLGQRGDLVVYVPVPGTALWVGPSGPLGFTVSNATGSVIFDPNSDGANNHSIIDRKSVV